MELCPTPDFLIDCAGGALDVSAMATLEVHLDRCAPCRLALVGLVGAGSRGSTHRDASSTASLQLVIASEPLQPGERVDRFQIVELKAVGGMGEVYLARDTQLGRLIALKRLRASGSSATRERLFAEARITARFNHPNIVTVYAVSEVDGRVLVALEYIEGETLRERLTRARPTLFEVSRIAADIAEALREAHRHDVVHCDLKPSNVM